MVSFLMPDPPETSLSRWHGTNSYPGGNCGGFEECDSHVTQDARVSYVNECHDFNIMYSNITETDFTDNPSRPESASMSS